jgi:hypothetical protein
VLVDVELRGPGGNEEVADEQEDHGGQYGDSDQDDHGLDDPAEDVGDSMTPVEVAHAYSFISLPV